jgi:hypothetical protein
VTKPALGVFKVSPQSHPVARLQEGKYDLARIKTVVISHKHFDHFGNLDTVSSFDPLVVVGPRSMEVIGQGYPEDENSPWPSTWLKDHRIFELPSPTEAPQLEWEVDGQDEGKKWKKIACFDEAVDWFADGSFYLINAPGVSHTFGTKTTTDPPALRRPGHGSRPRHRIARELYVLFSHASPHSQLIFRYLAGRRCCAQSGDVPAGTRRIVRLRPPRHRAGDRRQSPLSRGSRSRRARYRRVDTHERRGQCHGALGA